jgi:hypothetical protein
MLSYCLDRDWKGHKWADPKFDELKRIMRHVYSNRYEVEMKGKKARQFILENFSLEKVGRKLVEEFSRVRDTVQQSEVAKSEL